MIISKHFHSPHHWLTALALLFAVVTWDHSHAETIMTSRHLAEVAQKTPMVERPAKAAALIAEAPIAQQERIAIRVIRTFLSEAHSLAPSLIGSIAKQAPDVIVACTTEAVRLFPEQAYSIVKAAVAGAPDHAIEIALRISIENLPRAQEVLAGAIAADPEIAPHLLTALEQPKELQRTETQASLRFRGTHRYAPRRTHVPRPSIDINRGNRGVWEIHIEIPKGYYGNQIAKQLRRIIRQLLSHPRLRSKFKIIIHRYTH